MFPNQSFDLSFGVSNFWLNPLRAPEEENVLLHFTTQIPWPQDKSENVIASECLDNNKISYETASDFSSGKNYSQ